MKLSFAIIFSSVALGASADAMLNPAGKLAKRAELSKDLQPGVGFKTDFSTIDISRKSGGGKASLAAAEAVCSAAGGNAAETEDKRRSAENAELTIFNPAIDAAKQSGNKAKEEAALCQQVRNKVLKNTCIEATNTIGGNAAKAAEGRKLKEANVNKVDQVCRDVDAGLFVAGSAKRRRRLVRAKRALPVDPAASKLAKRAFKTDFATIDISHKNGDGEGALTAAKAVCPANGDAAEIEDRRRSAENAELTLFNPAIRAAQQSGNKAKEDAVLCQKLRNKVLKNLCIEVKNTIKDNPDKAADGKKKKEANIKKVDQACKKVDAKLFITA